MKGNARKAVAALALMAAVAACSSSSKSTGSGGTTGSVGGTSGGKNTASAPGVTASSINIGYITSLSGVASSSYADAQKGAQARIGALNAAGGINGRKVNLMVADDQSSPAGFQTAAQDLVNKGAFALILDSSFAFGGYRYLQKAGIPVTGLAVDGPEWGQQPNTNMFSYSGGQDPHTPANTLDGVFFKSLGVTNVAGLAYGISPSSVASIKDLKESLASQGIKMGYENLSVPFGAVDFTADGLAMKHAGVDAATCSCVQSTNVAMAVGAKQAGIPLKAALMFSGVDSSLFANATATQAAQGTYWPASIVPTDVHNPGTATFVSNLSKYDPSYKGGYPSFGVLSSYLGTVLMVEGLTVAGQNPTRQSFIHNLTNVTNWNAESLLASPVSFNHFGHAEPKLCQYMTKVEGNQFVTINNGKPYCGTLIPNSGVT
jgi:branched-chain amino acid transport system substrate-binding protein